MIHFLLAAFIISQSPNLHDSIQRENPIDELTMQLDQPGVDVNVRDENGLTPAMRAASLNRLDMLRALRGYHADLQMKDKKGRLALHHAILGIVLPADISPVDPEIQEILRRLDADPENFMSWDQLEKRRELLRYLIYSKENQIDAISFDEETPLSLASGFGLSALVAELLARGADLSVSGPSRVTALHRACGNLRYGAAKLLLDAGSDPDAVSIPGYTPLLEACLNLPSRAEIKVESASQIVQALIDHKANLNLKGGPKGRAALHYFAEKGRTNLLKNLVEAGASINLISDDERLPICCAIEGGHRETARYLASCPDIQWDSVSDKVLSVTPLQCAAAFGWADEISDYLGRGASLVSLGEKGTALHFAASAGQWKSIEALLKGGADVNAQNQRGKTALHIAVEESKTEILWPLIQNFADPNLLDDAGESALVKAMSKKNADALQLLLSLPRTNVNLGRIDYEPALNLAATQSDVVLLSLLLDRGADVNARGQDDATALIRASISNSLDAVRLLVDRKADMALADRQGMLARDWAVKLGHDEIVKYFDGL